jgi:hypothetical protein
LFNLISDIVSDSTVFSLEVRIICSVHYRWSRTADKVPFPNWCGPERRHLSFVLPAILTSDINYVLFNFSKSKPYYFLCFIMIRPCFLYLSLHAAAAFTVFFYSFRCGGFYPFFCAWSMFSGTVPYVLSSVIQQLYFSFVHPLLSGAIFSLYAYFPSWYCR